MTVRSKFDEELRQLHVGLIEMGARCEQSITDVSNALFQNNKELAQKVVDYSSEIDDMQREIERRCLSLLLRQQPVATDLRKISSALKMIVDMGRIGNQAEDIAEIIIESDFPKIEDFGLIQKMYEDTKKMVKESIDAYVKKDFNLAQSVIEYDDVLDKEFEEMKHDMIHYLANQEDQVSEKAGGYAIDLFMIAKYYERIGDHATNIAEWVKFSITGTL